MSFRTQLTSVFAKLFSSFGNHAACSCDSDVDINSNPSNSRADDDSVPEIMAMGLHRLPRASRRPQGRRGRAASR